MPQKTPSGASHPGALPLARHGPDHLPFAGASPDIPEAVPSNEAHVQDELIELENALEHRFAKRDLLLRALTHRSLAHEQAAGDNERLEFLGDSVLGMVVAEALFKAHSEWQEGELTRVRAQLVSRQHMAEVAASVDLGRFLRLSRGEERGGLRRKGTILSNTMEAVLAAVFLDGGLDPVRNFVRRRILAETEAQLARELRSGDALGNYKSALQEHLQAAKAGAPLYRVKSESGPDHRKRFLVEVRLKSPENQPGTPLARGLGSTKKLAEQDAARRALARLTRPRLAITPGGQTQPPGATGQIPTPAQEESSAS